MFHGSKPPFHLDWDETWGSIRDADDRYVSDACVEGDREQFIALAEALRAGESVSFKRLRAHRVKGGYEFASPRNTMGRSAFLADAHVPALIESIERAFPEIPRAEVKRG